MPISNGDQMPEGSLKVMTDSGIKDMSTADLFNGRKVTLFSVPGAFTPTCSNKYLPSYLENYGAIKTKGFDTIAYMAVNDVFVMNAWGKDRGVGDKIVMLADGYGEYTKKLDLELDVTRAGLGMRGKPFSIMVNDGIAEQVNFDESGYDLTSAEMTCGIG